MSYYVRTINTSIWPDGVNTFFDKVSNIRADAITSLRTEKDELSWWKIDKLELLEDLAISFFLSFKKWSNSLTLIFIDENEFSDFNFRLDESKKPYSFFNDKHFEMTKLTYSTLGDVATIICNNILKTNIKVFSFASQISKINNLIKNNLIDKSLITDENMIKQFKRKGIEI